MPEQFDRKWYKVFCTVALCLGYSCLGICYGSLGPTLVPLANSASKSLANMGVLFTARGLGGLSGAFLGGSLMDRVPGHAVVAGGLVIMASAFLAIALLSSHFAVLVALFVFVGAAGGILEVSLNSLCMWVWGNKLGPYMQGIHIFFGVGSIVAPLIASASVSVGEAYVIYATYIYSVILAFALVKSPSNSKIPGASSEGDCLVNDVALHNTPSNHVTTKGDEDTDFSVNETLLDGFDIGGQQSRHKEWLGLALVSFLVFLYVGGEFGFSGLLPSYATHKGMTKDEGNYLLSLLWSVIAGGRLVSALAAIYVSPPVLLLGEVCVGACSMILFMFAHDSPGLLITAVVVFGAAVAGIFPTLMCFPRHYNLGVAGVKTRWLLVGSAAGGMTVPWAMAILYDKVDPRSLPAVVLGVFVAMLAILLVLHAVLRR